MQTKPSIYLRWQGYYDYTKENVEKYVLKEPRLIGVYKIAELQAFGNLVPFFVVCSFKFASLLDEQEREDVVYTLCEHYQPLCNVKEKTSKTSLVNVNLQ